MSSPQELPMSQPPSPCGRIAIAAALLAIGATAISAALSAARTLRQPHYPVAGRVLVDGLPPAGAIVTLHPLEATAWAYPSSTAIVQDDGTFEIATWEERGAPAGEYAVTLRWTPLEVSGEDFAPSENLLPAAYGRLHTTPLRVTIAAQPNQLPPIELVCNCRNRFGRQFAGRTTIGGRR
jgi:hypothetical protein